MRFIKVDSQDAAAGLLLEEIKKCLSNNKKILWLLPGGSSINVASSVYRQLSDEDLSRLTVTITDERYGPVGHPDFNYFQLTEAGLDFSKFKASHPVLLPDKSLEETVAAFETVLNDLLGEAEVVIGQFGMGPDRHTAGIIPHSPASQEAQKLVAGYQAADFTRITMTFNSILMVDKSYVTVFGELKLDGLKDLRDKNIALTDQPVQIFKQVNEAYIINDMIGDN